MAISLPIVSLWANLLGGLFPLLSAKYGYNPAVTSAPLMTTGAQLGQRGGSAGAGAALGLGSAGGVYRLA